MINASSSGQIRHSPCSTLAQRAIQQLLDERLGKGPASHESRRRRGVPASLTTTSDSHYRFDRRGSHTRSMEGWMDRPQVGDQLHKQERPPRSTGGLTHSALLRDVLAGMYSTGDDATFRYDQAIESLRRDPEEMMVAIAAAYGHCPVGDYPQRHALVSAASVMAHEAALPFLASVALSDIPPEAARDPHSFSTVAEETIIRMSAVDGIAHHASRGVGDAVELLLRCVESPAFSIRRAAVTALMATPEGQRLRPRMEALVPRDQHFIFDLKKVSVAEAIQVKDPTRHLTRPHKEFGERKPGIAASNKGRGKPKTK
jgi:hypothetical protein